VTIGRTRAVALLGLSGSIVEIEADISSQLPQFVLIGLPDAALNEARDRVRAAIANSGCEFPNRRLTVNLSPAALPKHGSGFDLAIAMAVLAAAGLVPDLLGVMPDVPFGCHFRRAVDVSNREPYTEITTYLSVHRQHAAAAFRTLSYLDGVSFARRATAPALFSVGLMDPICPPSTVYAAYNHYGELAGGVDKNIEVYPFNEHEGGGGHQFSRQLPWLTAHARPTDPTRLTRPTDGGTR